MHALIIEDHDLIAWLIEEELRDLGYDSFDVASTEQQAILAAEMRLPDLVTSDGDLHQGSGITAVQAILARRIVPVVFLTDDPAPARALGSGAVVVEKPFCSAQLVGAVQQAARQAPAC